MKKELKTLGKRIAASALAIATAFVLIPFGGKEAKAEKTYPLSVELYNPDGGEYEVTTSLSGSFVSQNEALDKVTLTIDAYWPMEDGATPATGYDTVVEYGFNPLTLTTDVLGETYEKFAPAAGTLTIPVPEGYIGTDATLSLENEYFSILSTTATSVSLKINENYVLYCEEQLDAGEWGYQNASMFYLNLKSASATPSTYTVAFESNGGSKIDAQEVESGAKATKPTDPTKEGYTFDGWYSDKELTKAFDFATAITADTTVYAKWTEDKKEDDSAKASTDDGEVSKESPATNAMPTVVSNSIEELKTVLLTDEDIAALEAGEDIKVYFAVTDIASTIDATEKAKVEEATKAVSADYSIGAYLNIDLFKQVGDKAAAGVTSTKGKMKVTITLPETLQGDYTYKAVRVHHATADVLDATYNATAKTLTFESDQFSTYAIIYKKAEAATTTEATKSSPKTGDSALPFVAFAILGLSALAGAYSLKKFAK